MDIRETIIEAALKLLRKHGFGALSQPRILVTIVCEASEPLSAGLIQM